MIFPPLLSTPLTNYFGVIHSIQWIFLFSSFPMHSMLSLFCCHILFGRSLLLTCFLHSSKKLSLRLSRLVFLRKIQMYPLEKFRRQIKTETTKSFNNVVYQATETNFLNWCKTDHVYVAFPNGPIPSIPRRCFRKLYHWEAVTVTANAIDAKWHKVQKQSTLHTIGAINFVCFSLTTESVFVSMCVCCN